MSWSVVSDISVILGIMPKQSIIQYIHILFITYILYLFIPEANQYTYQEKSTSGKGSWEVNPV